MQKEARTAWLSRPLAELRQAANKGDAAAQALLGRFYREGSNGLP